MTTFVKGISATILLLAPAFVAAQSESAITADLAKKCRQEAIKAHPTSKAGTKASGVEKAQRDAYQACLAKASSDNKKNRHALGLIFLSRVGNQYKASGFGVRKVDVMAYAKVLLLVILMIGAVATAHAQGTAGNTPQDSGSSNSSGGVPTGRGPLAQPVPPAASTANPRQNSQQSPQRPQNQSGPTLTSPPQQPFGSSR